MTVITKTDYKNIESLLNKRYKSINRSGDDYWENAVIADSDCYEIKENNTITGFFCLNGTVLLRFYAEKHQQRIFKAVIKQFEISKAYVESYDPLLKYYPEKRKTAYYLYESGKSLNGKQTELRTAVREDTDNVIKFYLKTQKNKKFIIWYVNFWIERKGIYLLSRNGNIVATGEFRVYDDNSATVYLGLMVSEAYRRQGLGLSILYSLAAIAGSRNLKAVCSADAENIASNKTILKCGFIQSGSIYQILFSK